MAHEGFTIFPLKISSAQFGVYRVRGVSLIKVTYFDSCLVFFDFDILSFFDFWFQCFILIFQLIFDSKFNGFDFSLATFLIFKMR